MYAKALDRLWQITWVDFRFFGLRTLGDNERDRGWTTWACWLAFWLLIPIVLFGVSGYAVALVSSSLGWGFAAFTLLFCLHGLAIWGRLKNATKAIVVDPLQASWISSTLASLALLTACIIGLAVVSLASFSAGMSVSLLDLSSRDAPQTNKPSELEQQWKNHDPDISCASSQVPKKLPPTRRFGNNEVQTKHKLPVWWRSGDASMPLIGFDAIPIEDNMPWEHSEVCRPGFLFIFTRSSSDGPLPLNKDLSRKRAETLLIILGRLIEGCTSDQRPKLLAVSLGQPEGAWHDGSQRVVKIGRVHKPDIALQNMVLTRDALSVIGDSVDLPISQYEGIEVCVKHDGLACEWRKVVDTR